jgi:HEAT repeat protein
MANIGPQAAEALPDVKAFLERQQSVYYADELAQIGEPVVPMLVELAQAGKPAELREAAVRTLGELRDESVVPALLELLKDPDPAVRIAAAMQVRRFPKYVDAAVAVLCDCLRDGDDSRRSTLAFYLSNMGRQAAPAMPELLKMANQSKLDFGARTTAFKTLLEIDPANPDVQAAFLELLKLPQNKNPEINLSEHGAPLIPSLIQVVEAGEDPLASRAAQLLGDFEDKGASAVPSLRKLMNADEGHAGMMAAIALVRIDPNDQDALPRVLAAFGSQCSDGRYLEALRRLGPRAVEILPQLMEIVQQGRDGRALYVIGAMGAAAKPVIPLIANELYLGRMHQATAARTLVELGDNAADAIHQFLADLDNEDRRLVAVRRIGMFGPQAKPAAPKLLAFAQGDDPQLRRAALEALGKIEGTAQESVPLLATALSDPDPRIARAAIQGLRSLGSQAVPAMPRILAAFEQNRRSTRPALFDLLSAMGPVARDAIPTLTKLTGAPDLALRRAARDALKKIQPAESAASK